MLVQRSHCSGSRPTGNQRSDLQRAFSQHRAQTENQLDRLQKCFEALEEQPQQQECLGIRGIIAEKESFEQEDPSEDLKEIFSLGGTTKVEHYEIAAYIGLIDLAQKLGQRQAVRLLQQNLREEQQMLKKCEGFIKKFKPAPREEEGRIGGASTERQARPFAWPNPPRCLTVKSRVVVPSSPIHRQEEPVGGIPCV